MIFEGETPTGVWRRWWFKRNVRRQARRHLQSLFDDPAQLAGTSLRSAHRSRVALYSLELEEFELVAYTFTILRHPRPYPFSRQFHEVVESYRYSLAERLLKRGKSLNLSRLRQRDGEPQ